MTERHHHQPEEAGSRDVPDLTAAERDLINRELEGFVSFVDQETGALNARYWEVVKAVRESSDDPMSDPKVKVAYLELQGLQGEVERAADEARREIAHVRAEAGHDEA